MPALLSLEERHVHRRDLHLRPGQQPLYALHRARRPRPHSGADHHAGGLFRLSGRHGFRAGLRCGLRLLQPGSGRSSPALLLASQLLLDAGERAVLQMDRADSGPADLSWPAGAALCARDGALRQSSDRRFRCSALRLQSGRAQHDADDPDVCADDALHGSAGPSGRPGTARSVREERTRDRAHDLCRADDAVLLCFLRVLSLRFGRDWFCSAAGAGNPRSASRCRPFSAWA